jgi:hypothetical protein
MIRLALAAGLVWLVLILPDRPALPAAVRLPAELPLLLLVPALLGRAGQVLAAAALWLLAVQKLADIAMHETLGRGFNAQGDLPLLGAGLELLEGAAGPLAPPLVVLGAGLAALALAAALWWACGTWRRVPGRAPRLGLALLAGLLAIAGPARFEAAAYAGAKLRLMAQTGAALAEFRAAAAEDALAGRPDLFAALDRDLLLVFVESYGRTSLSTPLYAPTHLATLAEAEAALAAAGLATRSGIVGAPTRGGQSWLSHATLAQGLRIDDQARYRAALVSGRRSLFHHAQAAGLPTAAVMPAITRPWPEASRMGFDRILAAGDLGYRGLPFNWVTMPDQFTLAATDRLLRSQARAHPLVAQIALISSHAPWVPVPQLVPWQDLGDGRIFDAMATAGDPPAVVWRDRDRVRAQYRAAIDYSLRVVMDYARRHAADPPLLVVLGDHQAAPSIALDERAEVPLHLIGPPHLLARFDHPGLSPGLIPPDAAAVIPMEAVRDLILIALAGSRPAGAE